MEIIASGMEPDPEQERSLILRLLNRKVRALPETARSRIEVLTMNQLEALGEALLDFSSLFDLEDWLIENAGEEWV